MIKLKDEYDKFLQDIEKEIKDEKQLEYIKVRFAMFVDKVIDKIDMILNYKEERMIGLEEKQKEIENKIGNIQQIIDNIEKDIYSEEGFDFEIICPYCDNQFVIDVDENRTEVECPVCNNIIELDWSGDLKNDDECGGNCMECNGCDEEPEEEQDEQINDNENKEEQENDDDM